MVAASVREQKLKCLVELGRPKGRSQKVRRRKLHPYESSALSPGCYKSAFFECRLNHIGTDGLWSLLRHLGLGEMTMLAGNLKRMCIM
jgi:hypothetical protein